MSQAWTVIVAVLSGSGIFVISSSWYQLLDNKEAVIAGKVISVNIVNEGTFQLTDEDAGVFKKDNQEVRGIWKAATVLVDNSIRSKTKCGDTIQILYFKPPDRIEDHPVPHFEAKVDVGCRYIFFLDRKKTPQGQLGIGLGGSCLIKVAALPPRSLGVMDDTWARFDKELEHCIRTGDREDVLFIIKRLGFCPDWNGGVLTDLFWERADALGADMRVRFAYLRLLMRNGDRRALRALWDIAIQNQGFIPVDSDYVSCDAYEVNDNLFGPFPPRILLGIVPEVMSRSEKGVKYALAERIWNQFTGDMPNSGKKFTGRALPDPDLVPVLMAVVNDGQIDAEFYASIALSKLHPDVCPTNRDIFLRTPELYRKRWLDWWEKEGKKKYPSLEESLAKFAKEVTEQEKKDARNAKKND